jgi:hypothetical protein
MRKLTMTLKLVPLVLVSLVLWSCDDLRPPTDPASGLRPTAEAVFSSSSGQRYTVVRSSDALGSVTATIGEAGGTLMLGKHRLIVPKGAVSAPTVFSFGGVDSELVRVRLSATQDTHNDVGAAGFAVPIQLELSFDNADNLPENYQDLIVVYFTEDGLVEEKATSVDTRGHKAIGSIPHFSDYGLGWPL